MAGRRDLSLRNDDCVTDRAVLAPSLAGRGAGCRNSLVNDLSVPLGRDLFHTGEDRITNGALRTGFMTSLGAGSGLFRNFNRGMPGCVDCFGLGFIANCAGVGLDTGVLTGRRGRDLALIPSVALGGNLLLRFDNRSADRAADAIRQTLFGTGCGLAHNGLLSVAGRRDLSLRNDDCVTDRAVLAPSLAGRGAGCRNSLVNDLSVPLGRDLFHTGEDRITNGALRTGFMTSLGAGSGLFRNFNRGMPGCVDCFGLGFIANCAGVGLDTGVLTGRRGRDLALVPDVALSLNGFTLGDFLAADFADCITGVAVPGAGGVFLVDDLNEVTTLVLPLCIEGGIFTQINGCTTIIGSAHAISCRIPASKVESFTGEAVFVQRRILTCRHGLRSHRAYDRVFRVSVGFKVNRQLHRLFAAPNAIDIVDNIASVCGRSFGVRAVGVVQLGGGDGDLMGRYIRTALRVLIRLGLRAGGTLLVIDTGAVAGADVRAACGSVHISYSSDAAVDINLNIMQVCIGTGIRFAGRISH